jgi:aerobic-type carbon monoxide dehydrogenase small subunit (CoxS/CutS family)
MSIGRRGFIKGLGTTAAALPALAAGRETAAPGEGQPVRTLRLTVNGVAHRLDVEPRRTLAGVLRRELRLTGTKVACDRASCGACTVLLDGRPVLSCHLLALQADGAAVTTIEGLAGRGRLHPLQEAFIRCDATQCGFCTPGMIMALAGFLQADRQPTRDGIARALAGNLCRCGAYPHILDAAEQAAREIGRR